MKIAVVILNWNGQKLLEQFLPKVIKYSAHISKIFVADNNSTDGSVEYLNNFKEDIEVIINEKNLGFAGGYNAALKQVDAEYYILLNSDIEVTPAWIEGVISIMEKDTNVGACQPKILKYTNKREFEYAGAAGGFIDKLGYPFCRGRIFHELEKDEAQYEDVREIFWATGACMFVRASIFHKLGGFDDDFFAHMEEIDLCWRLKNQGYKIMYSPNSVIYHVGGATLNKSSPHKTYLNFRNNLSLVYKNIPKNQLLKTLLLRGILDLVAAIKFIFSGGINHFWAVFKAYISFYKSLQKTKEKRKSISQSQVSCIYQKSIVWNFYIKKSNKFTMLSDKDFS